MKRMLISLLISAAALFLCAKVLPENVSIDAFTTALFAAVVLAVVNAIIRPVVSFLSLPITFITLGLFSLVINALMLMLVDYFVDGFTLSGMWNGFFWALILGVAISFLTGLIEKLVGVKNK